jgi:hypothetical protein
MQNRQGANAEPRDRAQPVLELPLYENYDSKPPCGDAQRRVRELLHVHDQPRTQMSPISASRRDGCGGHVPDTPMAAASPIGELSC